MAMLNKRMTSIRRLIASRHPWRNGLLLLMTLAGCANQTGNAHTTTTNPSQIAYNYQPSAMGLNTPTIVFQSGLGDGQNVWQAVKQGLGNKFATFSYDRPGYGTSPVTHRTRNPCTIAQEQHKLLKSAGIKTPYLLVGHSLGGLYEYAYANLYPDEVAGVILLDPTHPQHLQRIQAEAPQVAALLSTASLFFSPAARQEFKQQQDCLNQLQPELAPSIPVRLLVSTQRQALEKGALEQVLKTLALDWQRMTHAPHIQAVDSGHYIQKEQPATVIATIHELLATP